ncbi:MAG TPA: phosphate ABC transporter substrate-binding protein [Usitatibacter sp.]|nr:phosphate ABC transporter substrate-binding protein [Usitatibacter sp.]
MGIRIRIGWAVLLLALGLNGHAAAQEVVAIVSAKSPYVNLTSAQVADIFLGRTSRFPDGALAVPIDQPEDSALRDRFYAQFTGKSAAQVKAHWSKIIFTGRGQPPRVASSGAETKRIVAENPYAIGYVDSRLVDDSVRVVPRR